VHVTGSLELFENKCPKVATTLTVYDYRTAHEYDLRKIGHG